MNGMSQRGMMDRKEAPVLSTVALGQRHARRFHILCMYSAVHTYCSKLAAGRCLLSIQIAEGYPQ